MNWQKVIHDLRDKGFRQLEIAEFCNCSQSYINGLAVGTRGKRLNFHTGVKLLEMEEKVLKGKIKPKNPIPWGQ